MAQEIEVKVKVVTDQAVNSVDKLGDAFDQTAKDAKEAQEVFATSILEEDKMRWRRNGFLDDFGPVGRFVYSKLWGPREN